MFHVGDKVKLSPLAWQDVNCQVGTVMHIHDEIMLQEDEDGFEEEVLTGELEYEINWGKSATGWDYYTIVNEHNLIPFGPPKNIKEFF